MGGNMNKSARRLRNVVIATLAMFATVFVGTTPAHADAYGVAVWSSQSIPGIPVPIPAGTFEHQVYGSGLTVTEEWAEFETAFNNVQQWQIDFRYFDNGGTLYKSSNGSLHSGGAHVGSRTVHPGTLKAGRACARLRVAGTTVATQCHYITK
jgi:hypothetical protein